MKIFQNTDRTILMCHPAEFDVSYVINPWMTNHVANCDNTIARAQWSELVAKVAQFANVRVMPGAAGLPDMVFTANAGIVLGNWFVPSNFKHAERKGEEQFFIDWFQDYFDVLLMPTEIAFEGAGDALMDRDLICMWMGYGHRTDLAAADWISRQLKIEVHALELVDDRFYHLDTCFCPLEFGDVMYYPPAFSAEANEMIRFYVPEDQLIVVSEEDALNFACNAVNLCQHVIMNKASDELKAKLQAAHYIVHETPLTEFMKAGGSAKCLTIRLNERHFG